MDDSSAVRRRKRSSSVKAKKAQGHEGKASRPTTPPPPSTAAAATATPPNIVHLDTLSHTVQQHNEKHGHKRHHPLSNMQARTLVVLLVGPAMLGFLASSKEMATLVACGAVFVGGMEWSGIKRHLKVSLLLGNSGGPDAATAGQAHNPALLAELPPSPLIPGTTVPLRPHEYHLPFVPHNLYNIAKHIAWAALCLAAYVGEPMYIVCLSVYFLVMVFVTLTAHNSLEQKVQRAMDRLGAAARSKKPADREKEAEWAAAQEALVREAEAGTRDDVDAVEERAKFDAFVREAQHEYFVKLELQMIAEKQPTEQLLDFCLDIFGLMWVAEMSHPFFLYQIPAVGRPWFFSCMVGNFMNDIDALLVGKGLRALRRRYEAEQKEGKPQESLWRRFVLSTPRPLYAAISPNKSLEGAVAGILTNGILFSVFLRFIFNNRFFHPPAPAVVAPCFQSFLFYLVVGLLLGVIGVLGDLLQSLLKRVARVKDAGTLIPGHGGLLDRVDGLLLSFSSTFVILQAVLWVSAWLAEPSV